MYLNLNHPGIAPFATELQHRFEHRLSLGLKASYVSFCDMLSKGLPEINAQFLLKNGTPIVKGEIASEEQACLLKTLQDLGPWRKGPWQFFDTKIDAEWRSDMKFDRLANHLEVAGKTVLDIGCGNGYFLYRLLPYKPKWVVGADPTLQFWAQFSAFQHYAACPEVAMLPLGFQDLECYNQTVDIVLCMGVLYHHPDPVGLLKTLKRLLKKGGTLFLETLIYDKPDAIALCPYPTYAGMRNVYFIPTPSTLDSWCTMAGFSNFKTLDMSHTTQEEQRATPWSRTASLIDQLSGSDLSLTKEGYEAPLRALVSLTT